MKHRWLIFFSLLGALLLYTGFQAMRLLRTHPAIAWVVTILLFILMFSWQFLARAGASRIDSKSFRLMAWTGSVALGIWATFIIFWLPLDVLREGIHIVRWLTAPHSWSALAAREWTRWVPEAIFVISVGLGGLGLGEALMGPRTLRIPIYLDPEHKAFSGIKIVQISDLHIGPMIRHDYVASVVRDVLGLNPDLIAVTGDVADGITPVLKNQVEPLRRLQAPLGVYFVTGNHEYYWGAEAWIGKMQELGMTPLINEHRVVEDRARQFVVAGVTDLHAEYFVPTHKSDPAKAMAGAPPSAYKILLAHRPSSCDDAEKAGFDLQLSGHTHGGQFFPFNLLIPLFYKFSRGLGRLNRMWIYVNPGTGYWGPPHRLFVSAEITLLELLERPA